MTLRRSRTASSQSVAPSAGAAEPTTTTPCDVQSAGPPVRMQPLRELSSSKISRNAKRGTRAAQGGFIVVADVKRPPRCAAGQPTQSVLIPETRDHAATQAVCTGSAATFLTHPVFYPVVGGLGRGCRGNNAPHRCCLPWVRVPLCGRGFRDSSKMFDHEGSPRLTLRVNYYSLPLNYASLPLLQEKSGHESECMAGTKPNANERKREWGKVQDCRYFLFF